MDIKYFILGLAVLGFGLVLTGLAVDQEWLWYSIDYTLLVVFSIMIITIAWQIRGRVNR